MVSEYLVGQYSAAELENKLFCLHFLSFHMASKRHIWANKMVHVDFSHVLVHFCKYLDDHLELRDLIQDLETSMQYLCAPQVGTLNSNL